MPGPECPEGVPFSTGICSPFVWAQGGVCGLLGEVASVLEGAVIRGLQGQHLPSCFGTTFYLPLWESHHTVWWITGKTPQGEQSTYIRKQAGRDYCKLREHKASQRGSHNSAPVSANVIQWTLSRTGFECEIFWFFRSGKGWQGEKRWGIPEFSLKVGVGHPSTYQWGHPLKEVDALPIVDVVCLTALGAGGGRKGE